MAARLKVALLLHNISFATDQTRDMMNFILKYGN